MKARNWLWIAAAILGLAAWLALRSSDSVDYSFLGKYHPRFNQGDYPFDLNSGFNVLVFPDAGLVLMRKELKEELTKHHWTYTPVDERTDHYTHGETEAVTVELMYDGGAYVTIRDDSRHSLLASAIRGLLHLP